jgi:hypothetical protein
VCCEDRTHDATHVIPGGDYVIAALRNYVIRTPSDLANFKIAVTGDHHKQGLHRPRLPNLYSKRAAEDVMELIGGRRRHGRVRRIRPRHSGRTRAYTSSRLFRLVDV